MLVVLIAGCGGDEQQTQEPRPARTAAAPSKAIFHTVANDMRDIGALAAGQCANEAAIRRAMKRLEADAEHLPFDALKAQRLVKRLLAETRDTLRSCP